MYLIKQYIIINRTIKKIINYIKISNKNAYQIGFEFSTLYNFISNDKKNYNNKINLSIHKFLLNCKNNDSIVILSKYLSELINYEKFFIKFNNSLLKLQNSKPYRLSSFFRGYYFNYIPLYGTNIIISKEINNNYKIYNDDYIYFVLYDFHNIYLDFIYQHILENSKFPCKIKYLLTSDYDKYSINEVTDDIEYKLVFIHKKKYYMNSIKLLLQFLFYGIYNNFDLIFEEEIHIYNYYKAIVC
jgi:hypothetical protein